MIVDSSALMAIVLGEDDAELYVDAMSGSPTLRISAATLFECFVVADRKPNPIVQNLVDDIVQAQEMEVVAFDEEQAWRARRAWRQFGKGSGHPAGLNYGDCMSYALAQSRQEPLLFKGDDFSETDLRSAI